MVSYQIVAAHNSPAVNDGKPEFQHPILIQHSLPLQQDIYRNEAEISFEKCPPTKVNYMRKIIMMMPQEHFYRKTHDKHIKITKIKTRKHDCSKVHLPLNDNNS